MSLPTITWGVNLVPFQDPGRLLRQQRMLASVNALIQLGIPLKPVNITTAEEAQEIPGWELENSIVETTRMKIDSQGPPFPFVRDLFDRAAGHAKKNGHSYFAIMNGDIILQPKLFIKLEEFIEVGMECMIFARTDIEDFPPDFQKRRNIYIVGQDVWVVKTEWWENNRNLFPNSIFPVRGWDVLYTSVMLCHSIAYLQDTEGDLCYHVRHPQGCGNDLYNDYNFDIEHGKWRIYSQRHNHYQYMVLQFYEKHQRMLNDEENAQFISTIFTPPTQEELDYAASLEKAFSEGRKESYMKVVI